MDKITVKKDDLIATLRDNRAEHREIFMEAQQAYRQQMIDELDRALNDAKNGRKIRRSFVLPVPEDHTADFDTAIAMLEWHQGDTVELEQYQFSQYVENNWQWRASFAANTESYSRRADR